MEYICTLLFVYVATSAVTSGCHTKDVAAASGNNADLAKGASRSVAEHKALYMSYKSLKSRPWYKLHLYSLRTNIWQIMGGSRKRKQLCVHKFFGRCSTTVHIGLGSKCALSRGFHDSHMWQEVSWVL